VSSQLFDGFASLDKSTREVVGSMLETQGLFKDVRGQMIAVAQLLNRIETLESLVINENTRTRHDILNALHQMGDIAGWQQDTKIQGMIEIGPAHNQRDAYRDTTDDIILESLRYRTMADRLEDVDEAHAKTFEWIFRNSTTDEIPWDSFVDWLESGSGVYWMNGKAGSGKSTLMIYSSKSAHETLLINLGREFAPQNCHLFLLE
jgi:hypothetical protein